MLYSHNYFRWSRREGDGADRERDGDGNEALFINLLCKQHSIRLWGRMRALVEAGGTGKKRRGAKTGARRVSTPFSHDRFLALIMLIFLWSARAKNFCLTAERTSGFFLKLALMLTGEKENDMHVMFAFSRWTSAGNMHMHDHAWYIICMIKMSDCGRMSGLECTKRIHILLYRMNESAENQM